MNLQNFVLDGRDCKASGPDSADACEEDSTSTGSAKLTKE